MLQDLSSSIYCSSLKMAAVCDVIFSPISTPSPQCGESVKGYPRFPYLIKHVLNLLELKHNLMNIFTINILK
jgi:hypothetical protein